MTARENERAAFARLAEKGRPAPVARVFPADSLTPVMLFRRMRASGAECFLLESVEGGESIARYTFLGCGPTARLTAVGDHKQRIRPLPAPARGAPVYPNRSAGGQELSRPG